MNKKIYLIFCVPALVLCSFLPARAGDLSALSFEGTATLASDYNDRGISLTPGAVAAQLSLDLVHRDGFFTGLFFSNVKDEFGHDIETEFYAGYVFHWGAYDLIARLSLDGFHSGTDSRGFFEIQGTLGRDLGIAYLSTGFALAPTTNEFNAGRSLYWFSEAEFPLPFPNQPPMSIAIKVGYEDFSNDSDKWDWSLGYYLDKWGLEWGLFYHDTNLKNESAASGQIVFSVRKYF